jgi:hypothetical protein
MGQEYSSARLALLSTLVLHNDRMIRVRCADKKRSRQLRERGSLCLSFKTLFARFEIRWVDSSVKKNNAAQCHNRRLLAAPPCFVVIQYVVVGIVYSSMR